MREPGTPTRLSRAALLALPLLLAACSQAVERCRPLAAEDLEDLSEAERNQVLSEGYSQLYEAASGMRFLNEFLLVKHESEATGAVIGRQARYAARLKQDLEQLAREYPALSIGLDNMPLLERKKRQAQQKDRARTLAPLVGARGADFERTLLLSMSGALNPLRFLVQALADAEKNQRRKAWMLEVQGELDGQYLETVALLDARFFRRGADTRVGAAGDGTPR